MKKKSFFEYVLHLYHKILDVVHWFSREGRANSFLAAISKKRSKTVNYLAE